jgi:hypothetical protein
VFSTRSEGSTLPIIPLVGRRRGVGGEYRVGLGQQVELAEDLGLEIDALGDSLDHHPGALDGARQISGHLDPADPIGMLPERLLDVGDVLLDVVLRRLALLGGHVEDAHVAPAAGVDRGDPAAERARPVDRYRALIDVVRQRVSHGSLLSCVRERGPGRLEGTAGDHPLKRDRALVSRRPKKLMIHENSAAARFLNSFGNRGCTTSHTEPAGKAQTFIRPRCRTA